MHTSSIPYVPPTVTAPSPVPPAAVVVTAPAPIPQPGEAVVAPGEIPPGLAGPAPANPLPVPTVITNETLSTALANRQITTTPPENSEDFSMFPGGVAPTSGDYSALGADGKVWSFKAGWPAWQYVQAAQPES